MESIIAIDRKKLITQDYKNVYPIKPETVNIIIESLHARIVSQKVGNNLFADGILGDTIIIILRDAKAVKQPRLSKIIEDLKNANIQSAIIIASFFSSGCYKVVGGTDYKIVGIEEFFDSSVKSSVKPKLGKYASKGEPGVKKETVVLRIPSEGYPELGLPGPLYAEDIYKIIEGKVNSNKNDSDTVIVVKAIEKVLSAFTEFANFLSKKSGNKISFDMWNEIMEKYEIYKYMNENGSKIEEMVKDVQSKSN